jgi:hypothetical protein
MKFLTDTGAEISIVKGTSLRPGFEYETAKGINVRGISNSLLKTEGTVTLRLLTPTQETTHTFHVMGDTLIVNTTGFWVEIDRKPLSIIVTVQLLWAR